MSPRNGGAGFRAYRRADGSHVIATDDGVAALRHEVAQCTEAERGFDADTVRRCATCGAVVFARHEHVRDQLAAVIADAPDTLTAANRCVHVLVLLGLLPETDR